MPSSSSESSHAWSGLEDNFQSWWSMLKTWREATHRHSKESSRWSSYGTSSSRSHSRFTDSPCTSCITLPPHGLQSSEIKFSPFCDIIFQFSPICWVVYLFLVNSIFIQIPASLYCQINNSISFIYFLTFSNYRLLFYSSVDTFLFQYWLHLFHFVKSIFRIELQRCGARHSTISRMTKERWQWPSRTWSPSRLELISLSRSFRWESSPSISWRLTSPRPPENPCNSAKEPPHWRSSTSQQLQLTREESLWLSIHEPPVVNTSHPSRSWRSWTSEIVWLPRWLEELLTVSSGPELSPSTAREFQYFQLQNKNNYLFSVCTSSARRPQSPWAPRASTLQIRSMDTEDKDCQLDRWWPDTIRRDHKSSKSTRKEIVASLKCAQLAQDLWMPTVSSIITTSQRWRTTRPESSACVRSCTPLIGILDPEASAIVREAFCSAIPQNGPFFTKNGFYFV